ncbi:P-loop NTPase fold protein [Photorhabdus temperata]|uniref:YobI family P-loop NTPase n=1 Tax=Photorhabdus temperata TaxID=574560 RepID=UPI000389EEFA|nr:P-loop NTPase fold protein [Photorhabdus temperata]EQB98927.1 hypothetical protein B738_21575 [Photorhabdus temperata subsp. temperata M1021]
MILSPLWKKITDKAAAILKMWQSRTSQNGSQLQEDFETLTPNVDPNNPAYKPYFNALDYALKRHDVKNIAVTGAYGAGKSSIILSYIKKISERKSLFHNLKYIFKFTPVKPADEHVVISLANFETDEMLKSSESLSKEQSIEYSILQQILYKVDKGSLPDSRVERIHTRTWHQILRTSSFLFIILSLVFINSMLLFPDNIFKAFSLPLQLKELINTAPAFRWVAVAILSFIVCWYLLSRFYRNKIL